VCPLRCSCRLLAILVIPAQSRRAGGPARAVDPGDLFDRDGNLVTVAPGEDDKGGIGAKKTQNGQPPDLPDQRKADQRRKNAVTMPVGELRGMSIAS
jgi:hypothetical protein